MKPHLSHIGRRLDPRYPTNYAIIVWCLLVGAVMLVFQLVSGFGLVQAIWQAFLAILTIFLVWALAREIDPEEPLSAFVGTTLMTISLFIVDTPVYVVLILYMMVLARIVNRSVGLPPTQIDSLLLLAATAVVTLLGSWINALMAVGAFLLDGFLPNPERKNRLFAVLALLIMLFGFIIQAGQHSPRLPTIEYLVAIVLVGLTFIPSIVKSRQLNTKSDVGGETLVPIRIQAIQVLSLVFGYWIAFWQGNEGIIALLPLWLTLAGIAIFPLIKPFLPNWNLEKRKKAA